MRRTGGFEEDTHQVDGGLDVFDDDGATLVVSGTVLVVRAQVLPLHQQLLAADARVSAQSDAAAHHSG